MSGSGHFFVEWKEQFVSQERGNRVVHYFLKDSAGDSILAVVGTERSLRHMFYVVADDFLKAYGNESSVRSGFKWRSRREVVDWLTSMLSKQHLQGDHSDLPSCDLAQTIGTAECFKNGLNAGRSDLQDDKRSPKGSKSDIVWSGTPWTCGKQLKHYPAFCRNGTSIAIQSFVFVMAKGENRYIAYVEDMYEDKRGQKKVKVRWFHHSHEVKGVMPLRNSHPKEVFVTPYAQVISAECVDGPAAVLTREHYKKCLDAFPQALLSRVHLCCRQFRSNRLKSFDLSKLRGYFDQPILSYLSRHESICGKFAGEEDEVLGPVENMRRGSRMLKNGKGCERVELDSSRVRNSGRFDYESSEDLNYGIPARRLLSLKHVDYWPSSTSLFKVNEKIELLSQDSGIRGCWFRCTVLEVSQKQLKVQYDDLQDEDDFCNLEEWIPAYKKALLDKLGLRHSGRPIIRPIPPQEEAEQTFEIGVAVDAWWNDGWWEGVVTGVDDSAIDNLRVYFPGESVFLNINKKDLRISRDWLRGQWFDIATNLNILSVISAVVSPDSKLSTSSTTIVEAFKSGGLAASHAEAPPGSRQEGKLNSTSMANPANQKDDTNWVEQQQSHGEEDTENDDMDTGNSCDSVGDVQGDDSDDNKELADDTGIIRDKVETEVTSGRNCDAVELMELTA